MELVPDTSNMKLVPDTFGLIKSQTNLINDNIYINIDVCDNFFNIPPHIDLNNINSGFEYDPETKCRSYILDYGPYFGCRLSSEDCQKVLNSCLYNDFLIVRGQERSIFGKKTTTGKDACFFYLVYKVPFAIVRMNVEPSVKVKLVRMYIDYLRLNPTKQLPNGFFNNKLYLYVFQIYDSIRFGQNNLNKIYDALNSIAKRIENKEKKPIIIDT